jgi:hypothetical protein
MIERIGANPDEEFQRQTKMIIHKATFHPNIHKKPQDVKRKKNF